MNMLDWDAESIYATVGVGGLGMLVLSLPWLDSQYISFWGGALLALLPAIILICANPDVLPLKLVQAMQWLAVSLYALSATFSIIVANRHGMAPGDGIFVGMLIWGAMPCALAIKRLVCASTSTAAP